MSSPAWTMFCENGHIVQECSHGYECREVIECPTCRSKNLKSCIEWGDPDYPEGLLVPLEPIRFEYKTRKNTWGTKREKIPVFDVSKLIAPSS